MNLNELRIEIVERRHHALKAVAEDLLSCFEAEHIPVSEVLSLLALVIHDRGKGTVNRSWMDCVGALEKAADHAELAEKAGRSM